MIDFTQLERVDFENFDKRRQEVMKQTQAEIDEQKEQELLNRTYAINWKLSALGITRPENITKDFVIGMLTQMNAAQFIGKDFEKWIDNQILIYWDLDNAFDDIVIRFL